MLSSSVGDDESRTLITNLILAACCQCLLSLSLPCNGGNGGSGDKRIAAESKILTCIVEGNFAFPCFTLKVIRLKEKGSKQLKPQLGGGPVMKIIKMPEYPLNL